MSNSILNRIEELAGQLTDAAIAAKTKVGETIENTVDRATAISRSVERREIIKQLMIIHNDLIGSSAAARADSIMKTLYPEG